MARLIAAAAAAAAVLVAAGPSAGARAPSRLAARVARELAAVGVELPASVALRVWSGATAVSIAAGQLAGGKVFAVLAGSGAAFGPIAVARVRGQRHRARADAAVPALLETAAASLRSGASLRGALLEAARATPGDAAAELRHLLEIDERPLSAALARWEAARPTPSISLAAAALALATATGGAAALALDRVAATIRDRHAAHDEGRALSTQARVSAFVLGCAPIGFGAVVGLLDPATAGFLVTTGAGQVCLVAGIGLDAVGLLWMRHLTGRVVA